MKKLILLLFITLVFTCSSDSSETDSNNDSNSNNIDVPLKEFLSSNVFFYPIDGMIQVTGTTISVEFENYLLFDFQTQPYSRIARELRFLNEDGYACGEPNGLTWAEIYYCQDFGHHWSRIEDTDMGELVEESDDKLIWALEMEGNTTEYFVEFTVIDNETILWKNYSGENSETGFVFWEQTL